MKTNPLKVLVPGIVAVAALALAMGVGAQMTPPPGHPMDSAADAKQGTDMKAECQAMMAKKQEMQDQMKAKEAALDKLVAEMNAAKGDAMEKSMAAVINELVAQRKASHAMMMEMQPGMMAHMMQHMDMKGAKGTMDCPMMKKGDAPEPKAEEHQHKR